MVPCRAPIAGGRNEANSRFESSRTAKSQSKVEYTSLLFENFNPLRRLEFEGLAKAKEVTDPTSKWYNKAERYAMDRYAYFMCAKCTHPYFAGQRRCDAGEEDKPFNPDDLVCGGCSGSEQAAECATHGKDFLEWKCQFCCSISSWYCWGKTHFCNDCHTKQQKGDYLTKKPKSAIPMCPGQDKCPLGVAHPHCEEFLLGCALCRNVRSF